MGIKGLSTFIQNDPRFLKHYELHNTYVVIDGDNLIHNLYFGNKVNVIYGGDYNRYAECIKEYFLMFFQCNIKPILVFDGGIDISGRKLNTIYRKMHEKFSVAKNIANNKSCYGSVLPILCKNVFICVLEELDIPYVICEYEADDQVAALANHYNCPVISADSDFFILDVCNGFIISHTINEKLYYGVDSNGKRYKYLSCLIYYIDEFILNFPGIDKSVLPLFSALLGNDYIESSVFDNFLDNVKLPNYEGKNIFARGNQRDIEGLLCWLKNKSVGEAVNQILQYMSEETQPDIKSLMQCAIESYKLFNCNLVNIVNQKIHNTKQGCVIDSKLITPCGRYLPLDFTTKYHSGHYSIHFANIIVLHKYLPTPQINDLASPSSYACSRYIRKIVYGILIRHDVDGKTCQSEKCLSSIEEYDRQGDSLKEELVKPLFTLPGVGILPKINELSSLTKSESRTILLKVLGISLDFFSDLPDTWQLFIGTVKYWLCNSTPYINEAFLYSLIINLIYFDVIKFNNPHKKTARSCASATYCGRYHLCSSIMCILTKIVHSEIRNAAGNLDKYLSNYDDCNNPLLIHIVHSYSQLQSCIYWAICLNKLLGNCFKNPYFDRCFSGSLLYNLTKELSKYPNPKLFVAELLSRDSASIFALFMELSSRIYQNVPKHCILKNTQAMSKSLEKML